MNDTAPTTSKWPRRLGYAALFLLIITLAALLLAGPGHRAGILGLRTAFTVLQVSAIGALLCILVGTVAMVLNLRRGTQGMLAVSVLSGLIGLGLTLNNASWFSKARGVPLIHDITTDTQDPPQFVAVAPLRADAPNPPEYEGGEVADKQREAYPDIVTIALDQAPGAVFQSCLDAAAQMGWELVAQVPAEGRIEATATTAYFGFKDDVVIRIRDSNGGSLVDVRSKSRVGLSDVGTNADRIRGFRDLIVSKP